MEARGVPGWGGDDLWTGCVWGGSAQDPKHLLTVCHSGISNQLNQPMAPSGIVY